jgi:starch synthase
MSSVCFYFQAHLPRQLKRNAAVAAPFDDTLSQQVLHKQAAACLLPVNELFADLAVQHDGFRVAVGVSGTLLEQAERFHPALLNSFQRLAEIAEETGRVEFAVQPSHYSLVGLFRDANRRELKEQISVHADMLAHYLRLSPRTFVNSAFLSSNSIVAAAAEMGYGSILCEMPLVGAHAKPAAGILTDGQGQLSIVTRHRHASDTLRHALSGDPAAADSLRALLAEASGEVILTGLDYRDFALQQGQDARDHFRTLVESFGASGDIDCITPSQVAEWPLAERPVYDVADSLAASWIETGDTSAWTGSKGQQELFKRYQQLADRVYAQGDDNLLAAWRHLGTADHFSAMSMLSAGETAASRQVFRFTDPAEAIVAYTSILTGLTSEVGSRYPAINIHKKTRRPRILLVTPEVTELPPGMGNLANFISAKGGGLADISAALVAELLRLGLDVHVTLPRYERQMRDFAHVTQQDLDRMIGLFQSTEAIHLVPDSAFVHLRNVYEHSDMESSARRAVAFQRYVINSVMDTAMPVHGKMLVHCNDWMTGLIPAAARSRGLASLFTVHNIHTGKQTLRQLERDGIDVSRFWQELYLDEHPDYVRDPWEWVGVDFLLSGVSAADYVNTVSTTFLQEIVNGYFPEIIPRQVRDAFRVKYNISCASGIINAPKSTVDPRITSGLAANYDASTVAEGKRANKQAFQRELGLVQNPDAPLFFWPHRLYDQKGPRLLAEIAVPLVQFYAGDGLQIAVVGNGDPHWERAFGTISCGSGGRVAFRNFDPRLSELGKAAADFILMPSLYEPCGLPQMEGMRFGTLPIVRATGGLKDTVEHLDPDADTGNGFVFSDFLPDALWWACGEAMRFHRLAPERKLHIIRRVMQEGFDNFNLEKTTLQYVRIYERLLGENLL